MYDYAKKVEAINLIITGGINDESEASKDEGERD